MRIGTAVVCALFAAACGTRAASGPAWPKLHEREHDGGESLEPHERSETAAAIEQDVRPAPPATEVPIAPLVQPPAPPASATDAPTTDETTPLQVEDMVIEIHDDQ